MLACIFLVRTYNLLVCGMWGMWPWDGGTGCCGGVGLVIWIQGVAEVWCGMMRSLVRCCCADCCIFLSLRDKSAPFWTWGLYLMFIVYELHSLCDIDSAPWQVRPLLADRGFFLFALCGLFVFAMDCSCRFVTDPAAFRVVTEFFGLGLGYRGVVAPLFPLTCILVIVGYYTH